MWRDIEATRLGPASHDVKFTLTERRPDFGVVKIHKDSYVPKEDSAWKEGDVIDLFPEKPKRNRLVFKYRKPVERTVEGVKDGSGRVYVGFRGTGAAYGTP